MHSPLNVKIWNGFGSVILGHMAGIYHASTELLGSKGTGDLLTQKPAREIRIS